jgi:molecular chaperone GrpE
VTDKNAPEALANAEETIIAEDAAEAPEDEMPLEAQLEAALAEAARNYDSFLRAQAELANVRKRFEKQRAQVRVDVTADLVKQMLPVVDDFARAMETVPDAVRDDGWFAGVDLVQRKLLAILENLGVQPIEAVGRPFDPNYHEALSQEPSDTLPSGAVTREMLKGYQLGDRVIRPSLVYVAE